MQKGKLFLVFLIVMSFIFCSPTTLLLAQEKETVTVGKESVQKDMPTYSRSLKQLIDEAKANIKKVDEVLAGKQKEEDARKFFNEGNQLYKEGKLKEAKENGSRRWISRKILQ